MNKDGIINAIKASVTASASSARYDAGMDGRRDDGGASMMEEKFDYWLDGVKFALSEHSYTEKYKHIVNKLSKESDPEYKEYLRMKNKFENKENDQ